MKKFVVTPEMGKLLIATTSNDIMVATQARQELGKILVAALDTPLKKGVMPGDIVSGLFFEEEFAPGVATEYPLDWLVPGTEKYFTAYVIPHTGALPLRNVSGSYVMVPTYEIGTSIDWALRYAMMARWNIVGRAFSTAQGAMTRKRNNDGWHVIITAASGRGISIYDSSATSGLFTKRLVSLAQTVMRRNAGGNSNSVDKGKLTHIAMSPEGLQDIRSWDLTQIDDATRREIFLSDGEIPMTRIFGVTLMDLDELGEGQEYQKYFNNTLGGSNPGSKSEIAIGLDLTNKNDSFVKPYRLQPDGSRVSMRQRITLIEQNRDGYYWREELGYSVLDARRTLLLGF